MVISMSTRWQLCLFTNEIQRVEMWCFHHYAAPEYEKQVLRDILFLFVYLCNVLYIREKMRVLRQTFNFPSPAFFAHSRRSWVTFASHCVTSPLLANLPSVFWRPRTWRKWMWEGCQVYTEPSIRYCISLSHYHTWHFFQCSGLNMNWHFGQALMCNVDACSGIAAYEGASLRAQPLGCSCSAHMLTLQYSPCTSSRSPRLQALAPSVGAARHCNPNVHVRFIMISVFFRSLRENQPAAEWKEAEEEEDDSEEEHFESVLQRVLQLWDSSWADAGKDMDSLVKML